MKTSTAVKLSALALCFTMLSGFGCDPPEPPWEENTTQNQDGENGVEGEGEEGEEQEAIQEGTYNNTVEGAQDKHKHRKFVGEPAATAEVSRSEDGSVEVSGIYDGLILSGSCEEESCSFSGTATLAGFNNAPGSMECDLAEGSVMTCDLNLGDGKFPNGPIIFNTKLEPVDAP